MGRVSGAGLDATTRGIQRMYDMAMRGKDMTVVYDFGSFRLLDGVYKKMEGYMRLLGAVHQLGLLEKVEMENGYVAATEAVLDGALLFARVKRGQSTMSAPAVVLKREETEAHLAKKRAELGI